jgi:hypothetical protein
MVNTSPTHRVKDGSGWEFFSVVTAKWEPLKTPPTQKLMRIEERDGWKYFRDPKYQPPEIYTTKNTPITGTERQVLERYLADIKLHEKLIGRFTDLPLMEQLRIAGDQVELVLASGYWLTEIE